MIKKWRYTLIFYSFFFCFSALKGEAFTLEQLLEASPEIKGYTPSSSCSKTLPATLITINGKRYEWHYFHFSNPNHNLPSTITFAGFLLNNDLLKMKSLPFQPVDGLVFECFDASRAGINEGVYFNIVLRSLDE